MFNNLLAIKEVQFSPQQDGGSAALETLATPQRSLAYQGILSVQRDIKQHLLDRKVTRITAHSIARRIGDLSQSIQRQDDQGALDEGCRAIYDVIIAQLDQGVQNSLIRFLENNPTTRNIGLQLRGIMSPSQGFQAMEGSDSSSLSQDSDDDPTPIDEMIRSDSSVSLDLAVAQRAEQTQRTERDRALRIAQPEGRITEAELMHQRLIAERDALEARVEELTHQVTQRAEQIQRMEQDREGGALRVAQLEGRATRAERRLENLDGAYQRRLEQARALRAQNVVLRSQTGDADTQVVKMTMQLDALRDRSTPLQSRILLAIKGALGGYEEMPFLRFSGVIQDQFIASVERHLQEYDVVNEIGGRSRSLARILYRDLRDACRDMGYNNTTGMERFILAICNFFKSIFGVAKIGYLPEEGAPETLRGPLAKRCTQTLRDELRIITQSKPVNIGAVIVGLQSAIQDLDSAHRRSIRSDIRALSREDAADIADRGVQ